MSTEPFSYPAFLPVISRRTFDRLDADHRRDALHHGSAQVGRDTVDGGRLFVEVRVVETWPLFHPGQTVMTTNIERHLKELGLDQIAIFTELIERHLGGDWGRTYVEDLHLNDEALRTGDRLFSVYELAGNPCWLISESSENPLLRPATTLLLPDDY